MIKIPDEVVEAGARALARYNCEKWDNDPDRWRAYFTDEARAAITAALDAWPGMRQRPFWDLMTNTRHTEIILPEA